MRPPLRARRPALNLMKETLTVRRLNSPALAEGDRILAAYRYLLDQGTAEEVWFDEVRRGVLVRWDILRSRALAPAVEPTKQELIMCGERLLAAGHVKRWGAPVV